MRWENCAECARAVRVLLFTVPLTFSLFAIFGKKLRLYTKEARPLGSFGKQCNPTGVRLSERDPALSAVEYVVCFPAWLALFATTKIAFVFETAIIFFSFVFDLYVAAQ